ncbi:YjcG family protein [Bacillus testis]|uniref:YjcG family protein n=1 Tax=Bacillus testis TaxID=1622072 RepID=UPI00067E6AF9|nr:YjcG family protein [Bacillus testis]
MKYGIAIFPSKKLQDLANSYRKRYDPHYSLIPPHLTLKEPAEAKEEEMDEIVRTLSKTAAKCKPFNLNILKVSTFQPVNNVIYLKAEHNSELDRLHNQLYQDLKAEASYAFVPHITVAQNLSDDEHSDVYGQMSMLDLRHEEVIDRFHLLYQLENGSWTVYETFKLEKGQ